MSKSPIRLIATLIDNQALLSRTPTASERAGLVEFRDELKSAFSRLTEQFKDADLIQIEIEELSENCFVLADQAIVNTIKTDYVL
jgi:hypothetical protein